MTSEEIERWIRTALLPKLGLKGNFDAFLFTERLAELKRKPIKLRPYTFPPGDRKTGMLIYNTDLKRYEIFYEENTTWSHLQTIIYHEDGHIALNHPLLGMSQEELDLVAKHFKADILEIVFREGSCSKEDEQEAEVFASVMLPISVGSPPKKNLQESNKIYPNIPLEEEVVVKVFSFGKTLDPKRNKGKKK